jgi:dipeptidyl aminopeptidase/acylaminoacyl peptidase
MGRRPIAPPPDPPDPASPPDRASEPEPFDLRTPDGLRLDARWWAPAGTWSHPAGGAAPTAVLVHGFGAGQDLPGLLDAVAGLTARGVGAITYDGRGHRASEGECTLGHLERLDVGAAVAAARGRAADPGRVVLAGESMGGISVLNHLAGGEAESGDGTVLGAVLVATPARWEVPRTPRGLAAVALTQTRAGRAFVARRFATRLAVRPERGAPPVEQAASVRCPVAVVHGTADRFCPPSAALALHDALAGPRLLDLVPGMGHGFRRAGVASVGRAVDWVVLSADAALPA